MISNTSNLNLTSQLNIIPTYRFRKNFAVNFKNEFKVGVGYAAAFENGNRVAEEVSELSFKIGYDF